MIVPFKVIPYSDALYFSWFHNFKSITISLKRNSVQVTFPSKVYSEFLAVKWVQFESIVVRPTKDIMYCILEHWCTRLGNNFRDRGVVCAFPYNRREGVTNCEVIDHNQKEPWVNPGSLWNSGRDLKSEKQSELSLTRWYLCFKKFATQLTTVGFNVKLMFNFECAISLSVMINQNVCGGYCLASAEGWWYETHVIVFKLFSH